MLRYLLDTNICIFTIKDRPAEVRERFNRNQGKLAVSTITVEELIYGAERSMEQAQNMEVLESFLSHLTVLPFDTKAAYHAGQIRALLSRKGTPIGPFDNQIAGHARSEGMVLVTNNTREFTRVIGLQIEDWVH